MRKFIILATSILGCLFISCNKTIYFAWDDNEKNYYTLEVKKNEVIYRASAFYHYSEDNIYIYLKDTKDKDLDPNNFSSSDIEIDFNNLVKICRLSLSESQKKQPYFSCKVLTEGFDLWNKYENERKLIYNISDKQDTIYLNPTDIVEYDRNYSNVKDIYLQNEGITKFPNKMYRIKKIDYKKFPGQIQKLNLNNPYQY